MTLHCPPKSLRCPGQHLYLLDCISDWKSELARVWLIETRDTGESPKVAEWGVFRERDSWTTDVCGMGSMSMLFREARGLGFLFWKEITRLPLYGTSLFLCRATFLPLGGICTLYTSSPTLSRTRQGPTQWRLSFGERPHFILGCTLKLNYQPGSSFSCSQHHSSSSVSCLPFPIDP